MPGFRITDEALVGTDFDCAEPGTNCPPQTTPGPGDQTIATRDLAVSLPTAEQTIEQGATGDTSALLEFAGAADPTAKFNLSVTSPLTGATFTPGVTSVEPATDSDTTVPIGIAVPADAPPGDYPYTVRAAVDGHPSEVREASGVLHVTAKPAPPQQNEQQPAQPQQPQQPVVTPTGSARLRVTTSVSPSRARPGRAVNLSLTVTNLGTRGATAVRVCQKAFSRTTLVSTKPSAARSGSSRCFAVGNLAAGQKSKKLTVKVRIKRTARAGRVTARGTSIGRNLPSVPHSAALRILQRR
jgi:hypothetical protein